MRNIDRSNSVGTSAPHAAPTAAADALAALLRRDSPPPAASEQRKSSAVPQDPRVPLLTVAVRAALFAVQSSGAMTQAKRALASWNEPHVIPAGDMLDTGTRPWFARTFIRVVNTGSIPTTAMVADQRLYLEPGHSQTVDGAWAAFIVRVTNMSNDPRSELTVTIT